MSTTAPPLMTDPAQHEARSVVFVQTAARQGNAVVAYPRRQDGSLGAGARYATGGQGGVLAGAVSDHLASQGSLAYDEARGLLYAVDAGSNALVMFRADGDRLEPPQRLPSGGMFPVSVALHGDLVYVLNGRGGGSIQGFRHVGDELAAIDGSRRYLALDTTAMPEFTHTPGQVAFTPAGRHLVVTTKAGDAILMFDVDAHGEPSMQPRRIERPGAVPFGFTFSPAGHLVVAEAGTNALSSFMIGMDGSLSLLDTMATGEAATCWVTGCRDLLFASNAGSSTITSMRIDDDGHLTVLATTPASPGTVDSAVSADGRFLYVQAGRMGLLDEMAIHDDGSLSLMTTLAVAGAQGGEGIVAR